MECGRAEEKEHRKKWNANGQLITGSSRTKYARLMYPYVLRQLPYIKFLFDLTAV